MLFSDWFLDDPIHIPQTALDLGFEDTSWHNDASPSLERHCGPYILRLWVGSETTKEEVGSLYLVQVYKAETDGSYTPGMSEQQVLYDGDDLNAALQACSLAIAEIQHGAYSFTPINE